MTSDNLDFAVFHIPGDNLITPDSGNTVHKKGAGMKLKKSNTKEVSELRGIFTIIKGQYKNTKPLPGKDFSIEGYNPESPTNVKWYQVMDINSWHTVYAGSSYEHALQALCVVIKHYKDQPTYYKHISDVTSDDYYDVHFLGRPPLTVDQRIAKVEGRCPRISPAMREMYQAVYNNYHYYFSADIEKAEDQVYNELSSNNVSEAVSKRCNGAKKTLKKTIPVKNTEDSVERRNIEKKSKLRRSSVSEPGERCAEKPVSGGRVKLKLGFSK